MTKLDYRITIEQLPASDGLAGCCGGEGGHCSLSFYAKAGDILEAAHRIRSEGRYSAAQSAALAVGVTLLASMTTQQQRQSLPSLDARVRLLLQELQIAVA